MERGRGVCATHPAVPSTFICERCGDFGCVDCRVGERCRRCAGRGVETGSYVPVPAAIVRRRMVAAVLSLAATCVFLALSMEARHPQRELIASCVLLLVTVAFTVHYLRLTSPNFVRNIRLVSRTRRALELYAEWRFDEAAAALDALCHEAVPFPENHAFLVQSLGAVTLALGKPERARELLRCAARSGWFSGPLVSARALPILHGSLALAEAMCGDRDAAERHAALARKHCPASQPGLIAFHEAYLTARDGRYDILLARGEEWMTSLSPAHAKIQGPPLAALRAFAIEARGGSEDEIAAMLSAIPEAARRGGLRSIGVGWSAMREFLSRRGLCPA